MSALLGLIQGRYYILEQIGKGGMTTVYRALDLQEERDVALKVLAPYLVKDPKFKARFEREVEVLCQFDHPNIVSILDFGEHEGSPFLVLPFLSKGTLSDKLEHGPLSPKEGARLMNEISAALAYAHERGVVHRDIKPSNILIDKDGKALLSDFGLAHVHDESQSLTGSAVIGTPAYMSPEQCGAGSIDARSDQYSFGVVLYQLTTGFLPFEADTPIGVALKHVNEPLPRPRDLNPNLPQPIEVVLIKALAKDSAHRYPSISAFNEAFQRALKMSLDPSRKDGGWASHLYQVTQVLGRIRFQSTSIIIKLRTMRRSVLVGSVLVLFGLPLAAYALSKAPFISPRDDLEATIAVLYTENAPRGDETLPPGQVETAVAGTLSVLNLEANRTPTPTLTEEVTQFLSTPLETLDMGSLPPTRTATVFVVLPTPTRIKISSTSAPPPPTNTPASTLEPTLTPHPDPGLTPITSNTPEPIDMKFCKTNPKHPHYCTPTPTP